MPYTFTINTDASYHELGNTASWATWIRSSHYKLTDSGLISESVTNSSVAELIAVENALLALERLIDEEPFLQHIRDTDGLYIYLNTDSMFVIQALAGRIKRTKYRELINRVRLLAATYRIDVRHVKAHTNANDSRSWVNNWCDRTAKSLVRKQLEIKYGRKPPKPRAKKVYYTNKRRDGAGAARINPHRP